MTLRKKRENAVIKKVFSLHGEAGITISFGGSVTKKHIFKITFLMQTSLVAMVFCMVLEQRKV